MAAPSAPPIPSLAWSRFIPRQPYPSIEATDPPSLTPQQWAFLALNCREAFYGGAAGGAKSDALLMAALQYVDHPNYAALLLRRTFPELNEPGALMDRAKAWLIPQGVQWNQEHKRFTFPSGATLSFGHMEHEDSRFRYQSSEFDFIGFDEVTHFTERQYLYVGFSRARREAQSTIPTRTRAAANPDGPGFEWVRDRMVNPKTKKPAIVFIPARLDDNPYLDREGYIASLEELDSVTRRRLLHGDWDVRPEGGIFNWWYRYGVVPELRQIVVPIDIAYTEKRTADWSAWAAWGFDGARAYVLDADRHQGETPEVERRIAYYLRQLRQRYPGLPVKVLHRDNVAIDRIAAQHLRAEARAPVVPVKIPTRTARTAVARICSAHFEGGQVLVPEYAAWLPPWLEQHRAYRDTTEEQSDDWIETTNLACWYFFRRAPIERPAPRQYADAV